MKYNLFSILFCLFLCSAVYAQSTDINTASAKYTEYKTTGELLKNTESLDKAKESIDKAIDKVKERQAANDPKLKAKIVAKAYSYHAAIYADIAGIESHPANEGALDMAFASVKASLEADAKGSYEEQNMKALEVIRAHYYNAGITGFQSKEYKNGLSSFETSLAVTDVINEKSGQEIIDTSATVMCAYCAQNGGMYPEAIKYYEMAVALDYDDENMYLSLNQLYTANEETDKAKAILEAGKAKYGPEKFMIAEINAMLKEGKNDEAVALMQEAVTNEAYSENASLLFALGSAYENLEVEGNKDKALEYYTKALDLEPDFFDAIYNTGALYYNLAVADITDANALPFSQQKEYDALKKSSVENFNKALPFFDKALAVKADDSNTLIALKEIHAQLGNMPKSNEYKDRYNAIKNDDK